MVERLCRAVREDGPLARRRELLCTLGHARIPGRYRARVTRALLAVLADGAASVALRAQAAESLGSLHLGAWPVPAWVAEPVRTGLDAFDAVELRLWCAYALGAFRYRPALPALALLASSTDGPRLEGWWSLAAEAADRITLIEGG